MKASFERRSFKVWEYKVSHGMLLVRSPKNLPAPERNIDIMLAGIDYFDLPGSCKTLELDDASAEDVAFVEDRLGKRVAAKNIFVFICDSRRHVVVAAGIKVAETEMDLFQSPFDQTGSQGSG